MPKAAALRYKADSQYKRLTDQDCFNFGCLVKHVIKSELINQTLRQILESNLCFLDETAFNFISNG